MGNSNIRVSSEVFIQQIFDPSFPKEKLSWSKSFRIAEVLQQVVKNRTEISSELVACKVASFLEHFCDDEAGRTMATTVEVYDTLVNRCGKFISGPESAACFARAIKNITKLNSLGYSLFNTPECGDIVVGALQNYATTEQSVADLAAVMRADYFNTAGRVAVLLDLLKQHAKSEKAVMTIGWMFQRINADLLAMPAAYSAIHGALRIQVVMNDVIISMCSAMDSIFESRQSAALQVFATDELVATLSRFKSHELNVLTTLGTIESYRQVNQAALLSQRVLIERIFDSSAPAANHQQQSSTSSTSDSVVSLWNDSFRSANVLQQVIIKKKDITSATIVEKVAKLLELFVSTFQGEQIVAAARKGFYDFVVHSCFKFATTPASFAQVCSVIRLLSR
jgi:hypothetical protein